MSLTNKQKLSIYKKSKQSGHSVEILEEVYRRGHASWTPNCSGDPEQFAYARVNSFVSGGYAAKLDKDLITETVDSSNPANREIGTNSLVDIFKAQTPGQCDIKSVIKKVVKEKQKNV